MATWLVFLCSVLGGWAFLGASALWRRVHARRAFDAEYRELVETTPIPLATLRSLRERSVGEHAAGLPFGGGSVRATPYGPDSSAPQQDTAPPAPLTAADREYFATCWAHIQGTFDQYSPIVALDLAEHLTRNLLITRRLDPPRPGGAAAAAGNPVLDSADDYLTARSTAERARRQPLSERAMRRALRQYKHYFDDVMALPPGRPHRD